MILVSTRRSSLLSVYQSPRFPPDMPHHGVAVRLDVSTSTTPCKAQRRNTSDEGQIELGARSPGSDTLGLSPSLAFPPRNQSHPHCAEAPTDSLSQCTKDTLELYSPEGPSPLQTNIPDELMPDELIVHDFRDLTHRCRHSGPRIKPHGSVRYRRAVFSTGDLKLGGCQLVPPAGEATGLSQHQIAHLYLSREYLGYGGHSTVFHAPFELRLDPTSDERTRVTVAVKTATVGCESHRMLHQEGELCNAFPRALMEESPKEIFGVGSDAGTTNALLQNCHGGSDFSRNTSTLPAVVPKFYGYYLPLDSGGNLEWDLHPDKPPLGPCKCEAQWRTALLLMEKCGVPINSYKSIDTHHQRYVNECLFISEGSET